MTTNLGAADPRPAGFSSDPELTADYGAADQGVSFRPELLGRLDAISRSSRCRPRRSSKSSSSSSPSCAVGPASSRAPGTHADQRSAGLARPARLRSQARRAPAWRRTIEDLVVAPIAERMAREPSWRDATIVIATRRPSAAISSCNGHCNRLYRRRHAVYLRDLLTA